MRTEAKKLIAGILVGVLALSGGITNTAMAAENPGTEVAVTVEENAESAEKADAEVQEEFEQSGETAGQGGQETVTSELQYLYVESPYIETPQEQNMVVSWGDGTHPIDKLEVLYQWNGQNGSFELEDKGEGLFLLQKEFTKEEAGVYALTDIRVTQNGEKTAYSLAEMGIEAGFGVDKNCPGFQKRNVDASEEDEKVAVVSESDLENSRVDDKVEEALEAAVEEVGTPAISAYALRSTPASERKTDDGQIVVALDPGHDSSHAGAYGNGIHEETANLKIAQYCKEELEKYANVKVYMCRTSAKCPYPETVGIKNGNIEDIKKRVRASVKEDADVYVSLHLNSYTSSAASGASVWYPDGSQTPNTVKPGRDLAKKIQAELAALGLRDRGALETDDNYACMAEGGKYNLPAIIVEHAYLSNSGDASKFLNSDAKLKKLGVADAAGIAKYFNLVKIGSKVNIEEGTYAIETRMADNMVVSGPVKAEKPEAGTGDGENVSAGGENNVENPVENSGETTENSGEDGSENETTPEPEVDLDSVVLTANKGLDSQLLKVVSTGDGYYNLIAKHSGKAIEVKTAAAGNILWQNTLNKSSAAQKWCFIAADNGQYYLKSALGVYMTVAAETAAEGTGVGAGAYKGSSAQKWKLHQKAEPVEPTEGTTLKGKAAGFGAIQFTWNKSGNAAGYQIQDVTSSTAKTAATISSGSTTSYKLTGLNCSTSYKYRIRAYRTVKGKKIYSEYSPVITVKTSGSVTGTLNASSVNVRSGPGTSYKSLKKLNKGNKVTVTGNSGSWYRISITISGAKKTAYISKTYVTLSSSSTSSAGSSASSGSATVGKPTLSGSASAFDKIKLTWKKVSGASGYVLQRYDSSSKSYKTIKTITSGSTTSYTNSSLNASTTYKYRLRAYKTVKGKKVYGSYSAVKSVKTKGSRSGKVTAGPLNVRSGAGTKYSSIKKLSKGTKVTVTGSSGDWYRISLKISGKTRTGYVSKKYVKLI